MALQWTVVNAGELGDPPRAGMQFALFTGATAPAKTDTIATYTLPTGGGNDPQTIVWLAGEVVDGIVRFPSEPVYVTASVARQYTGAVILLGGQPKRAVRFANPWNASPGDVKGWRLYDHRYDLGDVGSVPQTISLQEVGTVFEQVAVAAAGGLAEAGSGADTVSITVTVAVGDAGAGAEAVSALGEGEVSVADAGSGTEAVSIAADVPVADAGSGSESVSAAEEGGGLSVSDAFITNYASLNTSPNWTASAGNVNAGTVTGTAIWEPDVFPADQTAEIYYVSGITDGAFFDLYVRHHTTITTGTAYSIHAVYEYDDGLEDVAWTLNLYQHVNGTPTWLEVGAGPLWTVAAVKLQASGTTITAWYKETAGGEWVLMGSATDSAIASGQPGFMTLNTSIRLDNFAASSP